MSSANEKWWERLPRILGGWGFAVLIFFQFPFPEAGFVDGIVVRMRPGVLSWSVFVVLIVFAIGIAHSTVTGIVLGNVTKAIANVRRVWKGKRSSSAERAIEDPAASLVSLERTRKRPPMPDVRPPKKPSGR